MTKNTIKQTWPVLIVKKDRENSVVRIENSWNYVVSSFDFPFKRFCLALTLFPRYFYLVLKNSLIIGRESHIVHRQNLILINCIISVLKKLSGFLEIFYSGPQELTEWKSWIMFCPLFRLIIFRKYIFLHFYQMICLWRCRISEKIIS